MWLRQEKVKLDGWFFAGKLKVVKTNDVIGGEGAPNVDLEGRGSDSFVAVIEKVAQNVKEGRLIGDHLLKLALKRMGFTQLCITEQNLEYVLLFKVGLGNVPRAGLTIMQTRQSA